MSQALFFSTVLFRIPRSPPLPIYSIDRGLCSGPLHTIWSPCFSSTKHMHAPDKAAIPRTCTVSKVERQTWRKVVSLAVVHLFFSSPFPASCHLDSTEEERRTPTNAASRLIASCTWTIRRLGVTQKKVYARLPGRAGCGCQG